MKTNYKIILPIILLAGVLLSFNIKQRSNDPEKDKVLLGLIRYALTQGHYQPHQIDDEFSESVFTKFINGLDPTKRFFTQEDLAELSVYKNLIDDQIKKEDLTFYKAVLAKYHQRVQESKGFYKEILKHPFDYTQDETYNIDYENKEAPVDDVDLIVNWKKQLKLAAMSRLYDKIEAEKYKKEQDDSYVMTSFEELERQAREETEKNMEDFYIAEADLNDEDWFSVYINSISEEFDPHTSYFSPNDKKKFDIDMAGKLEGIGAKLQKKGNYTRVAELISGGPAWKAGELEVGDLILKVAQGDEEPTDIVGMRLDDAIEYIKGEKGTRVNLTLKKLDGTIKTISIVRDVVEIEETFAKSSIVEKFNRKFGVIDLPRFYINFNERNFRNSATDMAKEVERMNKENVEGLIIDLRNNGGGSLDTAIDIAGLFIEEGPIVQVKYKDGDPKIKSDRDPKIHWDKPLVILVNEMSASASEIFAAAMQDYKRAVIIGSKQTFGKGTVQSVLNLNDYYKYKSDLGALKMTIQKFYRVNGGSTQLQGVLSDVALPTRYTYMDIGERDELNPLNWDKIPSAPYKKWDGYENFEEAINNSKKRIAQNEQFLLIDKNAKWLKEGQEDNLVSLNLKEFESEIDKRERENKQFQSLYDYSNKLTFTSPSYELPLLAKDSVLAKSREIWHKNLSKDVYVDEALNVLADLKIKKKTRVVTH
ncbi:carboxy terminal-processing peptidase [Flavobacteriaceae bacterium F08102]|nr:carboxy terminal-processing peptidase [Flavobacteriaceae bacterium F08102]